MVVLAIILTYGANAQVTIDKVPSAPAFHSDESAERQYPLLRKSEAPVRSIVQQNALQLPQGLHAHTAFFCKIEDAIAKQNKVNFKFRLGSVDYVDAMEGKGYFQAVSYSRASNFAMQYQQSSLPRNSDK